MAKNVILVTGGSGLCGWGLRSIVEAENNPDDQFIWLSSKECDLCDLQATEATFNKYKPTHVIHLAAFVGGLYRNMKYKVEFARLNLLMNDNVLYCSHKYGVKKVVSCLSTCVFPVKNVTYPITEEMIHEGPPHPTNEGYSHAKRMLEYMTRAYHEQYGCNFVSVIPCNIFGPHDNYNLEDAHVIPALIHKAYIAKRDGTDFVIAGTGSALRQFLFSKDFGRLLLWAMRDYNDPKPVTMATDEADEVAISQVVELIAEAAGLPKDRIKFDSTKSDGAYKKTSSNAKLRSLLPDFRFTPFAEAIKESVEWLFANYETARK